MDQWLIQIQEDPGGLQAVERCIKQYLKPQAVHGWMKKPLNKYGGKCAYTLVAEGRGKELIDDLNELFRWDYRG